MNKHSKFKCTISLNTSHNGIVFTQDAIRNAIKEYNGKIEKGLNHGCFDSEKLDIESISHTIDKMNVVDNKLLVEMSILETPSGHIVNDILKNNIPLYPQMQYTVVGNEFKDIVSVNLSSTQINGQKPIEQKNENKHIFKQIKT